MAMHLLLALVLAPGLGLLGVVVACAVREAAGPATLLTLAGIGCQFRATAGLAARRSVLPLLAGDPMAAALGAHRATEVRIRANPARPPRFMVN